MASAEFGPWDETENSDSPQQQQQQQFVLTHPGELTRGRPVTLLSEVRETRVPIVMHGNRSSITDPAVMNFSQALRGAADHDMTRDLGGGGQVQMSHGPYLNPNVDVQYYGGQQGSVLPPARLSSANGAQAFIVDVDEVENNGVNAAGSTAFFRQASSPRLSEGQGQEPTATAGTTTMPSVKDLIKGIQGTLPFLILIFAKIMYDHRLGILVFVAMFGTFFHANSSLHKLIMQRDVHKSRDYIGHIAWIVTFLAGNIFFVYYVFEDQKLYRSLYFVCPDVVNMNLWNLLWVVGTTDFIIKYVTVMLKALIAAIPRQILPFKNKGKFFLFVETISQFYRSLVPIIPWFYFLQDDEHGGRWFSIVLLCLYIACKGYDIYGKFKEFKSGLQKFQLDLSYGRIPSRLQLESYDNSCPLCLDKFCDPIALNCKHVFCDECIARWFNQERTCPMCRANVIDHPQWRDGATNGTILLW